MKKIIISESEKGVRLDKFLKREVFLSLEITRGEIIKKIKNGEILINDKKAKPSYMLRLEDAISLKLKAQSLKLIPNPNLKNIKVIYQDEIIIVINKPAGLQAHPDHNEKKSTLVNWLIYKFPETKDMRGNAEDSYLRPGIVHRLDKDTSGVMVIARNQKTFEELKKIFKEHKIEKKYLVLVYGILEEKRGVIEKSIARASNYRKQVIAGRKTKTKIRKAVTRYKVLKEFIGCSLLEVMPKTGRMHQIRVHMFSIGHPVIGDRIYKLKSIKKISAPRQMLHAWSIKFALPEKNYEFKAEPPKDFKKLLAGLTKQQ